MQGATDGGKHIEGMRTGRMKSGYCELKATGCQGFCKVLEKCHEKYRPERFYYGCHHCHHLTHFRPWLLTERQKEFLLQVRLGPRQWLAYSKKPMMREKLIGDYVAPGRRKAQLVVRQGVRRRVRMGIRARGRGSQ